MTDSREITLVSADQVLFPISEQIAQYSEVIKNILEINTEKQIKVPLDEIKSNILKKVIEWIEHEIKKPSIDIDDKDNIRLDGTYILSDWEEIFFTFNNELFDTISAANFLHIKRLEDITCKKMANIIKTQSPENIRIAFNIQSD